ncbi:MAG: MaoC family dehydratase [Candidatus Dormibacteria bacterium]
MKLPQESGSVVSFGADVELYFEDFHQGQRFELGSVTVQEAEMLEFARRYDPQPFHVDPERARHTIFRGLIASGWQTAGIWMRLYCDGLLLRAASLGSPGVEELRWLAPVRPGDVLTGSVEVVSVSPSRRHPTRGTVIIQGELLGEDREPRMRLRAWGHFARRIPAPPD